MPTISTHLPEATYKRLRARLGSRQKTSAFVRTAIEEKLAATSSAKADSPGIKRIAAHVQAMLEDEIDIRIAEERLARIESGKSKTLKREDAWRELGL